MDEVYIILWFNHVMYMVYMISWFNYNAMDVENVVVLFGHYFWGHK